MISAEYITGIQNAIRSNWGCESTHLQTQPVKLMNGLRVLWDGHVGTFALQGCAKATVGDGWGISRKDGKMDYITVMKASMVPSAEMAVWTHVSGRELHR